MFIKKTICDKCGAELAAYPDKITLSENIGKQTAGRPYNSYKVTHTFHLCEKCRKQFNEFMKMRGTK